ncbi:hypothetical protein [Thiorhodovibrio litoralis]|uniref:hypothetical protein n=1 Tax=Thiorhodovibrio litoralis TaxID=2952932 RepID=UPI002B261E8A|nr:hypothetical protein [Thiorhodovibrio litoralis]WPL12187.1 hypothetical protein Thiosp_01947 [Thiorhodovibrio litoralis]
MVWAKDGHQPTRGETNQPEKEPLNTNLHFHLNAALKSSPALDQTKLSEGDIEALRTDNITLTRGIGVIGRLLSDVEEQLGTHDIHDIGSLLSMLTELSDVVSQAAARELKTAS